jgi:hypothetical protein
MLYDKIIIAEARTLSAQSPAALVEQLNLYRVAAAAFEERSRELLESEDLQSLSERSEERRHLRRVILTHRHMERVVACRMALDFIEPRGWVLAQRGFDLKTLASGKYYTTGGGCDRIPGSYHTELDHAYLFRVVNGRAAAVGANLYGWESEDVVKRCHALAERYGLTLEVPDYPSWYYPERAKLVVYIGPAGLSGQEASK